MGERTRNATSTRRWTAPGASGSVATSRALEARAARPVVVVVDDDADARDMLREVLALAGAQVVAVSSAADAVGLLRRVRACVLITDYAMPERTGIDLLRDIRAHEHTRDVPAIVLSGHVGALPIESEAMELGAECMAKPVDLGDLVAAVRRLTGWA